VANNSSLLISAVHNGTDNLAAGFYWFCSSTSSATAALWAYNSGGGNLLVDAWMGVDPSVYGYIYTQSPAIAGYNCTLGSGTCAAAWSGGSITWPATLGTGTVWYYVQNGIPLVSFRAH